MSSFPPPQTYHKNIKTKSKMGVRGARNPGGDSPIALLLKIKRGKTPPTTLTGSHPPYLLVPEGVA